MKKGPVTGRHAIRMIKDVFGIDFPGAREITLNARYDDVTTITVEGIAKIADGVKVETDDGAGFTKRYTVTVTPILEDGE